MDREEFLASVDRAIIRVYENDSELLDLKVSERAIAHRLAVYIEESEDFENSDVDCEYNRYGNERMVKALEGIGDCEARKRSKDPQDWITPDILIHRRESEDKDNVAVFEIKTAKPLDDCDRKKLTGMTLKSGSFRYDFGLGLEFYERFCARLLFIDGEPQSEEPEKLDIPLRQ